MSQEQSKKTAAEAAVKFIENGMTVGLGTGSTVKYFLEELARKIKEERLDVKSVPTSVATGNLAKKLGIPLTSLDDVACLDICVDGADEIDKKFSMIKGGGGALTREKIVASASVDFTVIVDESKLVNRIGSFPLPIEVIPFAKMYVARELKEIGGVPKERGKFITDNGNVILDVEGLSFSDPLNLETELNNIPGIVENGIFSVRNADRVIIGKGKKFDILRNE